MCEGVLGKGTFGDQWLYYSEEGRSCKGELGNKEGEKNSRKMYIQTILKYWIYHF